MSHLTFKECLKYTNAQVTYKYESMHENDHPYDAFPETIPAKGRRPQQ
jgi:hypothetical protein